VQRGVEQEPVPEVQEVVALALAQLLDKMTKVPASAAFQIA
jgi:hypothetical protein